MIAAHCHFTSSPIISRSAPRVLNRPGFHPPNHKLHRLKDTEISPKLDESLPENSLCYNSDRVRRGSVWSLRPGHEKSTARSLIVETLSRILFFSFLLGAPYARRRKCGTMIVNNYSAMKLESQKIFFLKTVDLTVRRFGGSYYWQNVDEEILQDLPLCNSCLVRKKSLKDHLHQNTAPIT